jgi:uncharacterized membrane protein YdbT with pleckstrin-like domain
LPEKPKTPKGYVDANLIAGEKVTYRGGLHWIVLVAPISIAVVIVLFGVAMLVAGGSAKETDLRELAYSAGALAILVAAIYLLVAILEWRAAEFAVTNKRVIFKVGVLKRRTQEMFLEKIESVNVDEGLLGRALDYGTVAIRGTGGTLEPFRNISHALEFRRQVQEQISQNSPQFARRSDPS